MDTLLTFFILKKESSDEDLLEKIGGYPSMLEAM
jgi:hypothetical protein